MGVQSTHRTATQSPIKLLGALVGVVVLVSLLLTISPSTLPPSSHLSWTQSPPRESAQQVVTTTTALCPSSVLPSPTPTAATATPSCLRDGEIEREFGKWNVRRSRVHEGSGYRLSKVWEKAARGETIEVAVLGGSVSTGHGAKDRHRFVYGAIKEIWHSFVVQWLEETLGSDQVRFVDGAKPAVDSGYFWWCYPEHIGLSPDIVLLESAVNDDFDDLDQAEDLLRSILLLPSSPAVIYVDSFAQSAENGKGGVRNGGDAHMPLSAFYDVPQISARGPLLPAMVANHSLEAPYFNTDPRHIAAPLHRFLGKMVVALLQDSRCRTLDSPLPPDTTLTSNQPELWPGVDTLGAVPSIKISDRWDSSATYPTVPPTCQIAGSTLAPSQPTSDWAVYSWKNEKFYLQTRKPNALVTFNVEVREGAVGNIAISYLRSKAYDLGKLTCSVGSQSVTVDGHWDRSISVPQFEIVARGLAPGLHELACRTPPPRKGSKARTFRLMGVMSM